MSSDSISDPSSMKSVVSFPVRLPTSSAISSSRSLAKLSATARMRSRMTFPRTSSRMFFFTCVMFFILGVVSTFVSLRTLVPRTSTFDEQYLFFRDRDFCIEKPRAHRTGFFPLSAVCGRKRLYLSAPTSHDTSYISYRYHMDRGRCAQCYLLSD